MTETTSGSGVEQEPQVRGWERFFKKYARETIIEQAAQWPVKKSVAIDYFDVEKHDMTLAAQLIQNPMQTLYHAEEALKLLDIPAFMVPSGDGGAPPRKPQLHVRLAMRQSKAGERARFHVPEDARSQIPPSAERLGRLLVLRVQVTRVWDMRPKLQDAVFQCGRCGAFLKQKQEEYDEFVEPLECYEDQGGCGRESTFKLIITESRGLGSSFVNEQRIQVEQVYQEVRPGMQAAKLDVYLPDDLCNTVTPGQIVYLTGIFRATPRAKGGTGGKKKSTTFDIFIDANNIEPEEDDSSVAAMTREEEALRDELLAQPDLLMRRLIRACAPKIRGDTHDFAKLVLLHSLTQGLRAADGRSTINVLFAGDSSTAKTELARWFSDNLARRVVHVDGSRATVAGLTIGSEEAGKDMGGRVATPGALVLGTGGVVLIDEAQLAQPGVLDALREAMDKNTVSATISSIVMHVRVDTTVVVCMNPPEGDLDRDVAPITQLDLQPALLSRFDAIVIFFDTPDEERDSEIATYMVESRYASLFDDAETNTSPPDAETALVARLTPAFLRKFVAEASTHTLLVPRPIAHLLAQAGAQLRKAKSGDAAQNAKHRQSESIMRFAEAHGKLYRRKVMTEADVLFARDLVHTLWHVAVGVKRDLPEKLEDILSGRAPDLGAGIDLSILNHGRSKDEISLAREIIRALREIAAGTDGITADELYHEFPGTPREKFDHTLRRLVDDGKKRAAKPGASIYERHDGKLKVN